MTKISVKGEDFYINDKKVYSQIKGSNKNAHGLLMNARFIQGIFDDKANPERFNRFSKKFNPEKNTQNLIEALPSWYKYGLRAFTVGLQGGGPCYTIENETIENNPFGEDGSKIDLLYLKRLNMLVRTADEIGMVVIVSFFYPGQLERIKDGKSVITAVKNMSNYLREKKYTNVIIEVCNEFDIDNSHSIINTEEGIAHLIDIAREESGGMLVTSSSSGGKAYKQVCEASDIIMIHGNGCSRQKYYNLIKQAREQSPNKPVVCNEDSQSIGQLKVAYQTHSSWGYYNGMTKQEPPTNWDITKGEDLFFATRMAMGIGIKVDSIPFEEQYYLQGLEEDMQYDNKRWIRLASLYPETIDYVSFYINSKHIFTCFDEPYTMNFVENWYQKPIQVEKGDEVEAIITLRSGEEIKKIKKVL